MNRTIRASFAVAAVLLAALVTPAAANLITFEVEGTTIGATSVESTQRVDAAGGTVHDVSVRFRFGAIVGILRKLAERISNDGAQLDLLEVKVTFVAPTGTVTEQRTYRNVAIKEVSFPALDGNSRVELMVTLVMEAGTMQSTQGGTAHSKIGGKVKVLTESNFRATMDDLPRTRIVKINSHRIIPCAGGLCDSMNRFEVVVRGTDVAEWRRWFQKVSQDPAYRSSGSYEILSPDLKSVLLTAKLFDMKPTTFTESTDGIGPNARILMLVGRARIDD